MRLRRLSETLVNSVYCVIKGMAKFVGNEGRLRGREGGTAVRYVYFRGKVGEGDSVAEEQLMISDCDSNSLILELNAFSNHAFLITNAFSSHPPFPPQAAIFLKVPPERTPPIDNLPRRGKGGHPNSRHRLHPQIMISTAILITLGPIKNISDLPLLMGVQDHIVPRNLASSNILQKQKNSVPDIQKDF